MIVWTAIKTKVFLWWDNLITALKYYRNIRFARVDLALLRCYLFKNPFRMSRQFFAAQSSADDHTYGETPLSTMEMICKQCGITERDTVIEMGAGRGRACFWMNVWLGCKVIGVEAVPDFVHRGQRLVHSLQLKRIRFRLDDYMKTDLEEATVIYLYGSCLSLEQVDTLSSRLYACKKGTKVITTSFPIDGLTLIKTFKGRFAWGSADIYYQEVP